MNCSLKIVLVLLFLLPLFLNSCKTSEKLPEETQNYLYQVWRADSAKMGDKLVPPLSEKTFLMEFTREGKYYATAQGKRSPVNFRLEGRTIIPEGYPDQARQKIEKLTADLLILTSKVEENVTLKLYLSPKTEK